MEPAEALAHWLTSSSSYLAFWLNANSCNVRRGAVSVSLKMGHLLCLMCVLIFDN